MCCTTYGTQILELTELKCLLLTLSQFINYVGLCNASQGMVCASAPVSGGDKDPEDWYGPKMLTGITFKREGENKKIKNINMFSFEQTPTPPHPKKKWKKKIYMNFFQLSFFWGGQKKSSIVSSLLFVSFFLFVNDPMKWKTVINWTLGGTSVPRKRFIKKYQNLVCNRCARCNLSNIDSFYT